MALFGKKKQPIEEKSGLFRPKSSQQPADLTHLRKALETRGAEHREPLRPPPRIENRFENREQREEGVGPRPPPLAQSAYLSERVSHLVAKGLSQPEIVKVLKNQGYGEPDIERAVKQNIKMGVESPDFPVKERSIRPREKGEPLYQQEEIERHPLRMPDVERRPSTGRPSLPARMAPPAPHPGVDKRDVEALVEEVVAEKWESVESRLSEIEEKFSSVETRLANLEDKANQIRMEETNKDKEISTKIDTYRESISGLSSKMEGMESVMKTSLSALLETTRSLSDVVESLKKRER